jgi:serine phosphatase RsbU (regulator of sigma subunit)
MHNYTYDGHDELKRRLKLIAEQRDKARLLAEQRDKARLLAEHREANVERERNLSAALEYITKLLKADGQTHLATTTQAIADGQMPHLVR